MSATSSIGQVASGEAQEFSYHSHGNCVNIEILSSKTKDLSCLASSVDIGVKIGASYTPRLDVNGLVNSDHMGVTLKQSSIHISRKFQQATKTAAAST
ncbi:hypothetical protein Vadar_007909 [Vaccinium darrowii]|uniref:Uncharacterized protein n=1 Tax=Vaccinium darrowii TaxID=229202 RepID=A0ACB7X8A9_9ERIC|nr:hypothetical protein Vadar_007909 [Vaccinium darrowii]